MERLGMPMDTIFKEFQPHSRDRSVEDRRRHRELVEKSIKENIGSIISDESIIGKGKNKKIKIPIRGLKEYYFKYGKNKQGVFSGTGEEEKGKNQKLTAQLNRDYENSSIPSSMSRKPKKISCSSFTCWELSRVNSFISFLSSVDSISTLVSFNDKT